MNKNVLFIQIIILVFLFLLCTPPIDFSTFGNNMVRSHSKIIGCYDYYSYVMPKDERDENVKFDFNNNTSYIDILENGWFLSWKTRYGDLIDCRRGIWVIDSSTLYLKYLESLIKIAKDTLIFGPKSYLVKWQYKEITDSSIILKNNLKMDKCIPIENEIINNCKKKLPDRKK